jgi:hypothetical protein
MQLTSGLRIWLTSPILKFFSGTLRDFQFIHDTFARLVSVPVFQRGNEEFLESRLVTQDGRIVSQEM